MKRAAAHRRIEIDTPRVTPQDPCNCGREDDGELFKENQKKHWIQTDYRIGLTDEDAENAITLLNDDE